MPHSWDNLLLVTDAHGGINTCLIASNQENSKGPTQLQSAHRAGSGLVGTAQIPKSVFTIFIPSLFLQYIPFNDQEMLGGLNGIACEKWLNNISVHGEHSVNIRHLHFYYRSKPPIPYMNPCSIPLWRLIHLASEKSYQETYCLHRAILLKICRQCLLSQNLVPIFFHNYLR